MDIAARLAAADPANTALAELAERTRHRLAQLDQAGDHSYATGHAATPAAAPTFKKGFGFHPLGAWLANIGESLAMLPRPGNAGSSTVTDHLQVPGDAIAQVPARWRSKIMVRADGAGATHDLVRHMLSLGTRRRIVLFTCGRMITAADEAAIAMVPASAWQQTVDQDGKVQKKLPLPRSLT